jgi:RNA polymerase sigma-54 factor
MADVADRLGVHPSTVSRTMKNKYIACKWGLFPLSYLCVQEVSGDTADYICSLIKEIVGKENSEKPLSDNDICKRLSDMGYDIARRTVAKYRDKLNIPSATGRRKRNL